MEVQKRAINLNLSPTLVPPKNLELPWSNSFIQAITLIQSGKKNKNKPLIFRSNAKLNLEKIVYNPARRKSTVLFRSNPKSRKSQWNLEFDPTKPQCFCAVGTTRALNASGRLHVARAMVEAGHVENLKQIIDAIMCI